MSGESGSETRRKMDVEQGERFARSPINGQYYHVTDWIDFGDGKIQATSKVPVTKSDVPDHWLEVLGDV